MYYFKNREILLIDPHLFGLSSRTLIGKDAKNNFFLIKDRKSRIIMQDGIKIFEQIKTIRLHRQNMLVNLATNAPICSKTKKLLKKKGIKIYSLE